MEKLEMPLPKIVSRHKVAEIYDVSWDTVNSWIEKEKAGTLGYKFDLTQEGKLINSQINHEILQTLALETKNALNKPLEVYSDPRLFEMMTAEQVVTLIKALQENYRILMKYSYLLKGALDWEKYVQNQVETDPNNIIQEDIGLILENIDKILYRFKTDISKGLSVNILDLGVGDGRPAIALIRELQKAGCMGEYNGVDISPKMLEIANNHITNSIQGIIPNLEVFDFENCSLSEIYAKIHLGSLNPLLVLFANGSISNSYRPLRILDNIRDGMRQKDAMILTDGIWNEMMEITFKNWGSQEIKNRLLRLPKYLGLTEADFTIEPSFDPKTKRKYIDIILKKKTKFNIVNSELNYSFTLAKNSKINIFTHLAGATYMDMIQLIDQADFGVRETSQTCNGAVFVLVKPKMKNCQNRDQL
jgi:SAM-dependent methyltransferase